MDETKKSKAKKPKTKKSKPKIAKPKVTSPKVSKAKTSRTKKDIKKTAVNPVVAKIETTLSNSKKVGQILKEERIKKGVSLNEVVNRLRIQRGYLESIEGSTYNQLPEMSYTLGFIRAYSQFLKLNPEHIIREFQKEYSPPKDVKDRLSLDAKTVSQKPNKNILWITAGGFIAIFLLFYIVKSLNYKDNRLQTTVVGVSETPVQSQES